MKITSEIQIEINRLYKEIGTYSGVAKIIGCAPTTVKRYIVEDFDEEAVNNCTKFTEDMMPHITNIDHIKDIENICDLCRGLDKLQEVIDIRKEILI